MAHRGPTPHLADTSALEQPKHSIQAATVIRQLHEGGAIATCEMLALEQLYSARSAPDREAIWAELTSYRWLNVTTGVMRRALEVQRLLTDRGHHRLAIADLIIAATAELNGAVVLHYDKDYDTIAAVTGQPTRWIVPRGTASESAGNPPRSR